MKSEYKYFLFLIVNIIFKKNFCMERQNQLIFEKLIKDFNTDFQECIPDLIAKKRQSASSMMHYLMEQGGCKIKDISNFAKSLLDQAKKDHQFAIWMGASSLLQNWIKFKIIQDCGIGAKDIRSLLTLPSKNDQAQFDLKTFLKSTSQKTNIESLKDEQTLVQLQKVISSDTNYIILRQKCSAQSEQQIPIVNNQLRQDQIDELKNELKQMKGSQLDQFIQSYLIKSCGVSYNPESKSKQQYSKQDFKQFRETLLKLAGKFGVSSSELEKELQTQIGQKGDYYSKIIMIRNKIHPVFVPQLIKLIRKNKSAKKEIANKDIVVLLGVSGAGKTTTIQILLGYKLKKQKKKGEQTTLIPQGGLKKEHKQFVTKASSKSVTKYVSTVKMALPQKYQKLGDIYLADTPGFFDSGGIIVDANNGLSTIRTISSASSVNFIFLINRKNWGTKGQGFKRLAAMISKLFISYQQSKVVFFLNCFNDEELSQLPAEIKNIKKELEPHEKGDVKYVSVVNHFKSLIDDLQQYAKDNGVSFVQAIKNNSPQIVVIDPFNPNLNSILSKVLHKERRLTNPKQYLGNILNEQVRLALCTQSSNLQTIIKNCLKNKQMDAALYYIKQLNGLAKETLDVGDIAQAQKRITIIFKSLQQQCLKIFNLFSIIMQKRIPSLRIDETTFIEAIQHKNSLQQLQKQYQKIDGLEIQNYKQMMDTLIKETCRILTQKLQEKKSKQVIDTIYLYSSYFNNKLKDQFVDKYIGFQTKIRQSIFDAIEKQEYNKIEGLLKQSQRLDELVKDIKQLNKPFDQWKSKLKNKVQQAMQKFQTMINQIKYKIQQKENYILTDKNINLMIQTFRVFSTVESTQRQEIKIIAKNYQQVRKICLNLARTYTTQIRNLVNSDGDEITKLDSVKLVQTSKQNATKMANITYIQQQINMQLSTQLLSLAGLIKTKRDFIDRELQRIQQNNSWSQMKNINTNIEILEKLIGLVEQSERQKCSQTLNKVKDKLLIKLSNLLQQARNVVCSLENADNFASQILQIYRPIGSILSDEMVDNRNEFQQKSSRFSQSCKNIKSQIMNKIDQMLTIVTDYTKKTMKQLQKDQIEKLISELPNSNKIRSFFITFQKTHLRPSEKNKQISDCRNNFTAQFNRCFIKLFQTVKKQLKQIYEYTQPKNMSQQVSQIKGEGKNVIDRQKIYKIVRLITIFDKIKNSRQLVQMVSSGGHIISQKQQQILATVTDIKEKLKGVFNQVFTNNAPMCYKVISLCQILRYLDNKIVAHGATFQQIVKELEQKLAQNEKTFKRDYSEIIKTKGGTCITALKKQFKYLLQFQEGSQHDIKLEQLLDQLINTKQNDEYDLVKTIEKQNYAKESQGADIQEIYANIDTLFSYVRSLKQLIGSFQSTKTALFTKYKDRMDRATQIKPQIKQKVAKSVLKLIEKSQVKVKRNLQAKKYNQTEQYLDNISKLQQLIYSNDLDTSSSIQSKKKKLGTDKRIEQYYRQIFQNQIKTRDNKYLSNFDYKKIDKDFVKQFNSFNGEDKSNIMFIVRQSIENQINKIKLQSDGKSLQQVSNSIKQIKSPLTYLPIQERQQLQKKLKDQIQDIEKKRKEQQEQGKKTFKFQQSLQMVLKYKYQKPYLYKMYLRLIQQNFRNKVEQIIRANQLKQLLSKIQQVFIKYIDQQQMKKEKAKQYNQIYQRNLKSATNHVSSYLTKLINKLKQVFTNQSAERDGKQIKKQANIIIQNVTQIFLLFYSHKDVFDINQLKKFQQQLDLIMDDLSKKCTQSFKQISLQKLRKDTKKSVKQYFKAQGILECIEALNDHPTSLKQIYNKNAQRIIEIQQSFQKLKSQIQKIKSQVKKTDIFSQNMKSFSNQQRKKVLQQLEQKVNLLNDVNQYSMTIYSVDCAKVGQQKSKQIQSSVKKNIDLCIESIKSGFSQKSKEFEKNIDVTLDIVKLLPENVGFVKINQNQVKKLHSSIQDSFDKKVQEMTTQIQKLKDKKNQMDSKLVVIRKQFKDLYDQFQKVQFSKYENKVSQLQNARDIELKNEKDEQKKQKINKNCQNQMKQLQKQFTSSKRQYKKQLQQKQTKKVNIVLKQINEAISKYSQIVTILYKAGLEISHKRKQNKQKLDHLLTENSKSLGKKIFAQVFENLQNQNNSYAAMLVKQSEVFKKNLVIQWQAKVKGNGIEYVLKNLQINQSIKSKLKSLYDRYIEYFNNWTQQYQKFPRPITIDNLINSIRRQSEGLTQYYHKAGNEKFAHPQKLLAEIFALWTITHSQVQDDVVQFYYQPHPAQIVSIFLTLSFALDGKQKQNPRQIYGKMAQIGTGQGKSVVLAGLSSYLALCGFNVNCVCYSMYLSNRDREAFSSLFQKLQITNLITYGTFDTICQSLFSKDKDSGGFRQDIKELMLTQKQGWLQKLKSFTNKLFGIFKNSLSKLMIPKKEQNRNIMLIDQVDVFFDPSFFGSLYCPDITISSQQIKKLMRFVWEQYKKNSQILDSHISKSQQFKNTKQKLPKLDKILDEQVKGMILGCRGCEHDYVIRDDLIQYKDQDGLSSKINYGFQTTFAYLKQHGNQRITLGSLQRALKISLIIAQFSYAMLPKYFRTIIGVTGTYQEMSSFKKTYMQQQYGVKNSYIIPSVYGNQKRRLINPPKITTAQKHWEQIIKQIKMVHSTERPVLVFFENASELQTFFNCPEYKDLQGKTTFLNQSHRAEDRDLRIKKTCTRGNITLMTNSFGRGTDFVVYDQSIFQIGHGGLHVIQTFLSIDRSQEVQIQGRTARQGNPGTFSLIIPIQNLQRLAIDPSRVNDFLHQLKRARQINEDKTAQESIKKLVQSNSRHQKCINVFLNEQIKQQQVFNYILDLNKYQQIRKRTCKTTIFIDGTGSMSSALQSLLLILDSVVKDTMQIVSNHPSASSFQLQLGVYRNYNCPYETLLEITPFETKSQNLQAFLKKITPQGGMGNEAIEVAYHHINNTSDIDQVILIGDAAGHTDNQTISRRSSQKGQSYWLSKNLPVLSAQKQLQKIKQKSIQVHSFYIAAENYFREVSNTTGGIATQFNVHSKDAASALSQFIVSRILQKSATDKNQADAMKNQYNNRKRVSK